MKLRPERGEAGAGRRRLTRRILVMLLAVGIVFGAVFGFLWYRARAIQEFLATSAEAPAAVEATVAELEPWTPLIEAVGTLRAVRGVEVSTEAAGVIESVDFESGDTVEQGQVLVQFSADADRAQLEAARVAAELAQVAHRRAKEQFAVQAISRAALDEAAAELRSARAAVEEQQALLARKTIRAPFAGRLGIRQVNVGEYINPGEPIVTLQALDPIYVDFMLPQQQLARIAVGQPVAVATNVYPGREFEGEINAIAPLVDPATRNIAVQGTLGNPEAALLPGMFATLTVVTGEERPRLTLPQTAITFNPYGSTVFVLEPADGPDAANGPVYVARQRFVETGERRGNRIAIESGVKPGELVVTEGQIKLRNNALAVVTERPEPGGEPEPGALPEAAAGDDAGGTRRNEREE